LRSWLNRDSWSPGVVTPPPTAEPHPAAAGHPETPLQPKVTYTVSIERVGLCEMPGPYVFRTSSDDEWHTLAFYFVAIRGGGKTVVINTGLPEDLSRLNALWAEMAGPRCQVTRQRDERLGPVLVRLGLNPRQVDAVLVTPFKEYLLENLKEFPNATVCVSQHGWTEHYLARRYPTPTPDPAAIPGELLDRLERGTPNKLRLLRDDDEVVPGVKVFWAGAHDRSSMAVVVPTAQGDVVITDACLTFQHIEDMVPIGTADSLEACLNAYVRIRHAGQLLVPLYDPLVLQRYEGGRIG
jgi:glyoxylase-like metal-dependent hydrolase (beta-lactamase superfamily II)